MAKPCDEKSWQAFYGQKSPESTARKNLRNYVWRLRKIIGRQYITADKQTVAFAPEADYQLDTETLNQGANSAQPDELIAAISGYNGELMPGFYDDWIQLERERLRALFERQMSALLEQLTAAARWGELISLGRTLDLFRPGPGTGLPVLITGHAALGDLSGAAAAYRRCLKGLADEIGVAPSQETVILYRQIENGELHFLQLWNYL